MKQISATNEQWHQLFDIVARLKKLAPWDWMYDSDIFGVEDPATGTIGYCYVLGAAGEEFGIVVHPGSAGLMSYLQIMEADEQPSQELMDNLNCLQLTFDNRDYVTEQDREVYKKLDLKFRGKKNWPIIRSYVPGYSPWIPNQEEVRFLINILNEAIRVCERAREHPESIRPRESGDMLELMVRKALKSDALLSWDSEWMIPDEPEPDLMIPEANITLLRDIGKSVSFRKNIWEFDAWFFPQATLDDKDERPYFPLILLWADQTSGAILSQEIARIDEIAKVSHEMFYKLLASSKIVPAEIWVSRFDLFDILSPICEAAKIQLEVYDRLIAIGTIRAFMQNSMG